MTNTALTHLRQGRWTVPTVVAALSAGAFALFSGHLIDDTYITLSYARNLALHGRWGLILLGTSNTATSPLSVLVLAALTFLVRNAVVAAGVLYVACQVVMYLGLRRLGERAGLPSWFSLVTVVLLTVNPLLVSSVGLEVGFGASALVWLLVYSVERRPVLVGVLVGVLLLIRVDLVLVAVVVVLGRRRFWVGLGWTALAAVAVALPWFLFSWVVIGSAVPDTLIIKTLQRAWGDFDFTNGPVLYQKIYPWATRLSFLPVLLGVVGLVAVWRFAKLRPFGALVPAGLVYYAAYSWLDVPPYHWYYGPTIVTCTIFLGAVVAALSGVLRTGAVVVVAALVVASVGNYVTDGVPRDYPPITTNHAATSQYLAIGRELGRVVGSGTVSSAGEIGALAYSCECSIVDLFDDRGAVGPAIAERKAQSGRVGRALIDLNFHNFDYGVRPIKVDYSLVSLDRAAPPPPAVVAQWPMSSPWAGVGSRELYLVRAG